MPKKLNIDRNSDEEAEPRSKKSRKGETTEELNELYKFYGELEMHPDQVKHIFIQFHPSLFLGFKLFAYNGFFEIPSFRKQVKRHEGADAVGATSSSLMERQITTIYGVIETERSSENPVQNDTSRVRLDSSYPKHIRN